MGSDFLLVIASFVGAGLLRYGGRIPLSHATQVLYLLPVVGVLKLGVFWTFGLYRGVWEYAGTPEAIRLLQAVTVASTAVLVGSLFYFAVPPIATLILDWMLTAATTAGRRFGRRAQNQFQNANHNRETGTEAAPRILIYGADDYGVFLLRYLRHASPRPGTVVGFLDPTHEGLRIQGLPVVDAPDALRADEILVPVPPSLETMAPDRDGRQICARYASPDRSCHTFRVGLQSSSGSPTRTDETVSSTR